MKRLVLGLWTLLMAASLMAALRVDDLFQDGGEPIAELRSQAGQVQIRPEGNMLWTYVANGQSLAEGTVVATGAHAKAGVRFRGGRELALGENSQIALTLGKGAESGDYLVTLLKGSLQVTSEGAAKTAGGEPRSLAIRAGGRELVLDGRKDAVDVAKALKQDAMITVRSGDVVARDPASGKAVTLVAQPESYNLNFTLRGGLADEAPAKPAPAPAPPPPPAPAPVAPPPAPKLALAAKPRRPAPAPQPLPAPKPAPAPQPAAPKAPAGSILWTVQAGEPAPPTLLAAERRAVAELPAGPVRVHLGDVKVAAARGWFLQSAPLAPQAARLTVHLASSRDLPRLSALMPEAGPLAIVPTADAPAGQGVFAVRDGRIVARIDLKAADEATALPQLLGLLEAQLAFRGPAGAFHPVADLPALIGAKGAKGGASLQLSAGGRLVPVHRRLLASFPDTAAAVAKMATGVFTEPVALVAPGGP